MLSGARSEIVVWEISPLDHFGSNGIYLSGIILSMGKLHFIIDQSFLDIMKNIDRRNIFGVE